MPHISNDILCITIKELEAIGVNDGYLKRARNGQLNGEVYCWEFHKTGKTVHHHYHCLKDKYKELIKVIHCDGLEPELYLKRIDEGKARAKIESLTDRISEIVQSLPEEIEFLSNSGLYTPTEAHQMARAAGWLRLISEVDVKRARNLGFESIDTFRNEMLKRCLNEQTANPPLAKFKKGIISNLKIFYRNALQYKREGIQCLIHKNAGNINRQKGDTQGHAKLITLASSPLKFSFEDIAMMYNNWAIANGKEELTTSAVKQYLNTPKIKKVWFYARHGKLAADNELQPLINRDKPSFPDALWTLDGTSMQLYYRDEKGNIRSDLYQYFVFDANTGALLGLSVGYTETSKMVEDALRCAINKYEYKPYQLQYDNGSANISVAIRSLMDNMSRVHFPCEPLKGRSKYAETLIGHFQQRVLRYYENFKGGNITSKSLNSKANPELLALLKKNSDQLPTLDEVLAEIWEAANEWNNRGEKRDSYGRFVGESKIQRYINVQHDKRVKLNYFDKLSLFMLKQRLPYTYGVNGIELEIDGVKRHYIVPDGDTPGDFIFANENLGRKFIVKVDREKPEMIALYGKDEKFVDYAYEKERYASCIADLKDGEKAKQVMFKQKQELYGVEYSRRELERQMMILNELPATGTDGFGWWDTPKHIENKRQAVLEDAANGISDGLTEKQRRILSIGK